MSAVAGVDGCPGGWVVAVEHRGDVEWRKAPLGFGALLSLVSDCAVVAVDVPIGFGPRACDLAARALLVGAASRVFVTPPRAVLEAPDYASACAVSRAVSGKAISRQMWAIGGRVVDATDHADARVVEAHPEVSFLRMTGRVLPSKHTAVGRAARVEALGALAAALPRAPGRAGDAIDALACAWTARRVAEGTHERIGDSAGWIVS